MDFTPIHLKVFLTAVMEDASVLYWSSPHYIGTHFKHPKHWFQSPENGEKMVTCPVTTGVSHTSSRLTQYINFLKTLLGCVREWNELTLGSLDNSVVSLLPGFSSGTVLWQSVPSSSFQLCFSFFLKMGVTVSGTVLRYFEKRWHDVCESTLGKC